MSSPLVLIWCTERPTSARCVRHQRGLTPSKSMASSCATCLLFAITEMRLLACKQS